MNTNFKTLAFAAFAAITLNVAHAADTKWTWNGSTNADWNNKSNWTTSDLNSSINNGDTVIIPADITSYPVISSNVEMASLELNGGNINLNGRNLTVYGITKLQGGMFINPVLPVAIVTLRGMLVNFTGSMSIGTNINIILTHNNANFVNGVLVNANPIVFEDNVTATIGTTSFIDGPVTKKGNDAFTFPVGDNGFSAPISISAPNNSLYSFTASYINNVHSNPSVSFPLSHISEVEYWTLVKNAGNAQSVNVALSYSTGRSGIVNQMSDLVVASYNGSVWSSLGGSASGNNNNGTVTSGSTASSFIAFTLGSVSTLNPLPIKLLSFTAAENNNDILVKWTTISEDNNDFFTIEKSFDGKNWMEIGQVEAAGNSTDMNNYEFSDKNAQAGVQYYRLKQTDFNGAFTYTSTVAVSFRKTSLASVYPNPAAAQVNISLESENGSDVRIYNAAGQLVMSLDAQTGIVSLDITELPNGIYSVEVISENQSSSSKLVKK